MSDHFSIFAENSILSPFNDPVILILSLGLTLTMVLLIVAIVLTLKSPKKISPHSAAELDRLNKQNQNPKSSGDPETKPNRPTTRVTSDISDRSTPGSSTNVTAANPETANFNEEEAEAKKHIETIQTPSIKTRKTEKPGTFLETHPTKDGQRPSSGISINTETKAKRDSKDDWINRLRLGLAKTRNQLHGGIKALIRSDTALDDELLERLHEVLFRSDIGVATSDKLVAHLKNQIESNPSWRAIESVLHKEISKILSKNTPQRSFSETGTEILLIVGVNGVGKTTTIGKLAAHYVSKGESIILCAADTFRAAAIEQIKVWGERLNVPVIAHQQGSDPAAVAYDGVKAAVARKADKLIIDTAGRLHSKKDLMAELNKINRVIGKDVPSAPHETWIVIDSTTGQNALGQVKAFSEVVQLTGIIASKLDGTAKGGVLISLCDQFPYPIRFIGIGESVNDLQKFSADEFAQSIFFDSSSQPPEKIPSST